MFKSVIVGALLAFGMQSYAANITPALAAKSIATITFQDIKPAAMLNWTVGSTADYNVNMGFISGNHARSGARRDSARLLDSARHEIRLYG